MFDSAFFVAVVSLSIPLLWASLGELISERSGVINIGLEGMVILGAFVAFYASWLTGSPWLGTAAAIGAGLLMAIVMALVSVSARADQIISGLGLFIVGGGIAALAFQQLFTERNQTVAAHFSRWKIPGLAEIPLLGEALFDQGPLVYLAFIAVPLVYVFLWRTKLGLVIRASGEAPEAVDAGGSSVEFARWVGVLSAGIGGGIAGAALTIGALGVYADGINAGRGFLAIAAVLFGRWKPLGTLGACLLFGGAEALQLRLQSLETIPAELWIVLAALAAIGVAWSLRRPAVANMAQVVFLGALTLVGVVLAVVTPSFTLPSQLWLMLPYVTVIVVLTGVVGAARMPLALGMPHRRAASA